MGWSELLLIGIVALIVVGPKDLPVMFQSLGKMTAKVKRMAREFQSAMADAADSTGMKDVASDLNKTLSPKSMGIDKLRDAADRFDKWDPTKKELGPETAKLSEEREEAKRKIQEATAKTAQDRKSREAAAAASEAAELADEPEPPTAEDSLPETDEQPVNGAAEPVEEPASPKAAGAKSAAATAAAENTPATEKNAAKSEAKPESSGDSKMS